MAVSRRRFIRTLGGGGVVLGAGALGLARCDRMPREAVAAWNGPVADVTDPRVWSLS